MEKQQINLRAPINTTGYGRVGFNVWKNLFYNDKYEVKYYPIGETYCEHNWIQSIQQSISTPFKPDSATLSIWHEHDAVTRIGKIPNFLLTFFERDVLCNNRRRSLDQQDGVLVTSAWAEQIVKESCPNISVNTIPLGVDTTIFKPIPKTNVDSTFRILNCGKWEIRKGHDVLVDIINKAFTPDQDVELIMSTSNPFISKEENEKWQRYYLDTPLGKANKIKFVPFIQDNQLNELYNLADVGIFPTKSEGYGLPILEMMACNKPVIVTNYSAITAFCNKDNSYLVDIDEVESAFDGRWFFGDSNWAKIGQKQVDQFVNYLTYLYNNRGFNPEGFKTAESLTWQKCCDSIGSILFS
jgi:glycosyltransferase involved in cell wall biosynthesis